MTKKLYETKLGFVLARAQNTYRMSATGVSRRYYMMNTSFWKN